MVPFLLASLSGVLLVLSFPNYGHPGVAWLALAPLIFVIASVSTWQAAWLGLLVGTIHFLGTIYWIPTVMVEYGGLPVAISWLVYAAFVLYLALFPCLFAVMLSVIVGRVGALGLLVAPAVWVTTELGRMYLFTGFPWALLGYSQVPFLAVAQAASVVGVLGVSALVVSTSAVTAYVLTAGFRRSRLPVAVVTLVVGGTIVAGAWRVQQAKLVTEGVELRVAALQGNVAQDDKWNPLKSEEILSTYVRQSEAASEFGAQLIIWPEAATPFPFATDPRGERIQSLAARLDGHLLIGTTEIEVDEIEEQSRYYNSAYMLDQAGEPAGVYRKQHLVPFGEYVPVREALFFISPLVETVADFSPGAGPQILRLDDHGISAAICYEIIYPSLVRELVLSGASLITTLTNDAWYGRSAAPYQHFQQARMRAIEQGRYLVRAANTGISAVVDPYGRVLARSRLFEQAVVYENVRLLHRLTPYGHLGDLTAYLLAFVTFLTLGATRRNYK